MRSCEGNNTPLHFAAFRYNDVETIRLMISKYPAALLAVNRYGRIPVETAKTKFAFQKMGKAMIVHPMGNWATSRYNHVAIVKLLEQATESYGAWRNQLCVHCCANRLFLKQGLQPFVYWMGTESLFALNMIGMCLQNGMKPVAMNIISFVGTKIGIDGKKYEAKDHRNRIKEENKDTYLAQLADFFDQVGRKKWSDRYLPLKELRKVGSVYQYAEYALVLERKHNRIPCGWQALFEEGYRKKEAQLDLQMSHGWPDDGMASDVFPTPGGDQYVFFEPSDFDSDSDDPPVVATDSSDSDSDVDSSEDGPPPLDIDSSDSDSIIDLVSDVDEDQTPRVNDSDRCISNTMCRALIHSEICPFDN
mmetsp:Transcript_28982/g.35785  ORF Transcript_28982/g.35785 Transcript_28982/m.35785 type:complete len:362 (-) Transcript_28982:81-1166(-)